MRPWPAAIAWGLLILLLTLLPAQAVPGGGLLGRYHLDKLAHAVLFGVFLVLLVKALRSGVAGERDRHQSVMLALVLSLLYGGSTELLQELMGAGRRGDVMDMAADALGVILGAAYLRWGAAYRAYFRNRIERYF
jgi:VanZ family protein